MIFSSSLKQYSRIYPTVEFAVPQTHILKCSTSLTVHLKQYAGMSKFVAEMLAGTNYNILGQCIVVRETEKWRLRTEISIESVVFSWEYLWVKSQAYMIKYVGIYEKEFTIKNIVNIYKIS